VLYIHPRIVTSDHWSSYFAVNNLLLKHDFTWHLVLQVQRLWENLDQTWWTDWLRMASIPTNRFVRCSTWMPWLVELAHLLHVLRIYGCYFNRNSSCYYANQKLHNYDPNWSCLCSFRTGRKLHGHELGEQSQELWRSCHHILDRSYLSHPLCLHDLRRTNLLHLHERCRYCSEYTGLFLVTVPIHIL